MKLARRWRRPAAAAVAADPGAGVLRAVAIAGRNVDPRPYYVLTPPPPLLPADVLADLAAAGRGDLLPDYRRRVRDLGGTSP